MRMSAEPSQAAGKASCGCAKLKPRGLGDFAARSALGEPMPAGSGSAGNVPRLPEGSLDRTRGRHRISTEVELKLAASEGDLPELKRALVDMAPESDSSRCRLISTYYDTPDLALKRRGMTLRVREQGGRFIQTVKSGRSHRRRSADARRVGGRARREPSRPPRSAERRAPTGRGCRRAAAALRDRRDAHDGRHRACPGNANRGCDRRGRDPRRQRQRDRADPRDRARIEERRRRCSL